MARREAPAFSRGNAAHKEQWLRHLARHLPRTCGGKGRRPRFGGESYGVPGAAKKQGGGALAV